jgi:hypothetical protein
MISPLHAFTFYHFCTWFRILLKTYILNLHALIFIPNHVLYFKINFVYVQVVVDIDVPRNLYITTYMEVWGGVVVKVLRY